jgi:hypothetical protein
MGHAFNQPIRDGIGDIREYYWQRTGGYSSRSAQTPFLKPLNLSHKR